MAFPRPLASANQNPRATTNRNSLMGGGTTGGSSLLGGMGQPQADADPWQKYRMSLMQGMSPTMLTPDASLLAPIQAEVAKLGTMGGTDLGQWLQQRMMLMQGMQQGTGVGQPGPEAGLWQSQRMGLGNLSATPITPNVSALAPSPTEIAKLAMLKKLMGG